MNSIYEIYSVFDFLFLLELIIDGNKFLLCFNSDAAAKPVNKALERLVKSGELQLVPSAFMSVNLDSVIMITILALSLFIYKTKMTLMFGRFEIVDAFEAIQKEFSESSFS